MDQLFFINSQSALANKFTILRLFLYNVNIFSQFSEGDPNNYLTYFKRGTVYLALGKAKFALLDFDKVLDLKPDFHSVRYFIYKLFNIKYVSLYFCD